MQQRIETAGCLNAAKSVSTTGKKTGLHSGLGEVSMEQVLAWNPDILIINTGTVEELRTDPRWQPIQAVRNNKVYMQPSGVFIFDRPTSESAVLYTLWLACTAYPDLFSDISLPVEVKRFYRDIFHFDLTDDQVNNILAGEFKSRVTGGVF
jgi:iron complex transport system substrate-binding protein